LNQLLTIAFSVFVFFKNEKRACLLQFFLDSKIGNAEPAFSINAIPNSNVKIEPAFSIFLESRNWKC